MAAAKKRIIDLDKARAARAEVDREPVTIKFKGETFDLPVEVPADFSLLFAAGDPRGAYEALLDENAERFFELKPSAPDLNELYDQLQKVYGADEGE
jgi:predicted PolB exonuclease-like 3'-5' exonuclease